jgi:hypothetical protein
MDNYNVIKNAILNKKQIKGNYGGYYRELCPHAMGKNKNGTINVISYQFGGATSKGALSSDRTKNWKCMDINKLTITSIEDGIWHSADNHSKPATCIDDVEVEIAY